MKKLIFSSLLLWLILSVIGFYIINKRNLYIFSIDISHLNQPAHIQKLTKELETSSSNSSIKFISDSAPGKIQFLISNWNNTPPKTIYLNLLNNIKSHSTLIKHQAIKNLNFVLAKNNTAKKRQAILASTFIALLISLAFFAGLTLLKQAWELNK